MQVKILGSGTSTGVPIIGCKCSVCTSTEPRNKRTRASLTVTQGDQTILIDTSPEMRLQLLANGIDSVAAVLYTHMHADHTAGFDDLRAFYFRSRKATEIYLLPVYINELKARFHYAFEDTGYQGTSPQVHLNPIPSHPFTVAGMTVEPAPLHHGHALSCAFKFGRFVYATDFKAFPPELIEAWRGKVDVMVASGIHFGTHVAHSVIPETIQLFDDLGVKRGVISHLAHDVDYVRDTHKLPPHVEFAYDGMTIDLTAPVS